MQFICDVCSCTLFIPLSEVGIIKNSTLVENECQLIKKEGTSNYWKCAKCGEVYSSIIDIVTQKIISTEGDIDA